MDQIQLILVTLWIVLMLTYLLGDVLRIFAGDFVPGEIQGKKISQKVWLGISVMMVMPIVMTFLTLVLDYSLNRGLNLAVAGFFFVFNLFGLPTYPTAYDRFLIVVGLVFNVLTLWYAFNWVVA
jgi:hypothetical protein